MARSNAKKVQTTENNVGSGETKRSRKKADVKVVETKVVHKEIKSDIVDLFYSELKPEDKRLTQAQVTALEKLKTTSARIRFLDTENLTTGNIARMLGIRYQHARNVLITPLKREVESKAVEKDGKAAKTRANKKVVRDNNESDNKKKD